MSTIFDIDVKLFYINWYRRSGNLKDPCSQLGIQSSYKSKNLVLVVSMEKLVTYRFAVLYAINIILTEMKLNRYVDGIFRVCFWAGEGVKLTTHLFPETRGDYARNLKFDT